MSHNKIMTSQILLLFFFLKRESFSGMEQSFLCSFSLAFCKLGLLSQIHSYFEGFFKKFSNLTFTFLKTKLVCWLLEVTKIKNKLIFNLIVLQISSLLLQESLYMGSDQLLLEILSLQPCVLIN